MESKIKGALYGFAIGDAMGATTEFMSKESIQSHYGIVDELIGGGWLGLKPGEVTDDTQMMLCVCDAIEQSVGEKEMLDRCCENFIEWYHTKPVDIGCCCRRVIEAGLSNPDSDYWRGFAKDSESLGNGSLMRTLPIVLSGLSEETAMSQGQLTHNNAVCDYAIKHYHRNIISLLENNEFYNTGEELFEPVGHVINTLSNALYWAQNSSSLAEAIINAVNHGGDADTIAAITGSLVGALYGYDAIPSRWVEQLKADTKQKLDRYVNIFAQMYVRTNRNIV